MFASYQIIAVVMWVAFLAILYWAIYWVIRLAVRHAIRDADKRRQGSQP